MGEVVDAVGAVVLDRAGRLLMVRRGHDPDRGRWSVPGGRVEDGESDAEAVAREVLEETALAVQPGALLGEVRRDGPGGVVYAIRDYRCTPVPGSELDAVRPGDDAAEVGWFSPQQLRTLDCTSGLLDSLTAWGALPADPAGP